MGVKQFKISIPVPLKVLIFLKNKLGVHGMDRGAFLNEIVMFVKRSKTTTNEVLRFLEEKKLIIRRKERSLVTGKRRKENFISQAGLDLLKVELYDIYIPERKLKKETLELEQERKYIFA